MDPGIFKFLCVISVLNYVHSAHIIGVPSLGISHGLVLMKIGRELVKRNHRFSLVIPSALKDDLQTKELITPGLQVVSFESNFTKEALEKLMIKQSQGKSSGYQLFAKHYNYFNNYWAIPFYIHTPAVDEIF